MAYPHETDENGVVVKKNPNAGVPVAEPEQAQEVTGRPNDLLIEERKPALDNSTFAGRARARQEAEAKALSAAEAENKAVTSSETKGRRRRS